MSTDKTPPVGDQEAVVPGQAEAAVPAGDPNLWLFVAAHVYAVGTFAFMVLLPFEVAFFLVLACPPVTITLMLLLRISGICFDWLAMVLFYNVRCRCGFSAALHLHRGFRELLIDENGPFSGND